MSLARGTMVLLGCVLGAVSTNRPVQALEALVTWTDPDVTISGEHLGGRLPSEDPKESRRPLRQWDRLPEGTQLQVPPRSKVSLLCSSDHWIDLQDIALWNVTPKACAVGRSLEWGTFRRLTPRAGRYMTEHGILVRKRSVRGVSAKPIMLSPRQSSVDEARPTLVWRDLHEAGASEAEYELHLSGLPRPIRLPLRDLDCRPDERWGGEVTCRMPWPAQHPGLEPGQRVFWQIGFRSTISAPLVLAKGKVPVQRLSDAASTALAKGLEEIVSLPLEVPRRTLLQAGLYARYGLFPSALDAYGEAVRWSARDQELDRATLIVTRGDLYLAMGLWQRAEAAYQEALLSPDATIQAAASAGLGESLVRRRAFAQAVESWRRAQALYAASGWTTEAADAEAAALDATQRSGSKGSDGCSDEPPSG